MPTVPVISIPLNGGMYGGLDAFLAPQVPTGTAVIGGVSIRNYDSAFKIAKEILTNEFEGVYVYNVSDKLKKKLAELEINILGEAKESLKEGLVLGCIREGYEHITKLSTFDKMGLIRVFTPNKSENLHEAGYFMRECQSLTKSLYVRGDENLAFFAAKIMSAYNLKIRDKLYEKQKEKADSYEKREIVLDEFMEI